MKVGCLVFPLPITYKMSTLLPRPSLRIVTWNVNGLRSYITDCFDSKKFRGKTALAPNSNLAELLEKTDANVLCFQETRANAETMGKFQIPGWRIWSHSSQGEGARRGNSYSGTSIWVHESFLEQMGEPLTVLRAIPTMARLEDPPSDITRFFTTSAEGESCKETAPLDPEGRFIALDFGKLLILNSYVPNSGSNAVYRSTVWDPAVEAYLKELAQTRPETRVVWCADWNVAPTPRDFYHGDPIRTPNGQRIVKRHTELGHRGSNSEYIEDMGAWRREWEQTDAMQGKGTDVQAGFLKVERDAWQRFLEAGYVDSWRYLHSGEDYTGYTWYSLRADGTREARLGWRIDHILVSQAHVGNVCECRCLPEVGEATKRDPGIKKYGSDHVPLFARIQLS